MAHDFSILEQMGSTKARIREVFTALDPASEAYSWREKWRKRIEGRIQQGARFNLNHYQFYAASDLAWDSNSITKDLVPLMMYAQGKIQFEKLKSFAKDISPETQKKLFQRDQKSGDLTGVNIPEFFKVSYNLVRSLVTRRTAAVSNGYVANFPFYKYEPRSTSSVAKLRGDVLSQRVEMIVDQYGYRHDLPQAVREMLLYGFSAEFVVGAWDVERGVRKAPAPADLPNAPRKLESYITREGVSFHRPHPSRVIWDFHQPLSSLNFDNGLSWIGYWNIVTFRDVDGNPAFFNRDKLSYSNTFTGVLNSYSAYWELYFSDASVKFPSGDSNTFDLPGLNDREKQAGIYTSEHLDQSVLLTEYFERVIPKDVGLGDYAFPIWVRLVVAGGTTVVYGEFLPDTPGVVYQYNIHDGRLLNNSFATDALPYQDQLSNQLTLMLHAQKSSLVKLIGLDIDQINDPEVRKAIRDTVTGDGIYTKVQLVEYKGSAYAEVGMNPRQAISISETDAINDVTMYMRTIMQVISLAEKSLGIAVNETGQSEQREISATENANIANTTNTTLNFMGLGVDEALDAKKRIVANALLSLGSSRIQVPVANRYLRSTIEAAGFTLVEEKDDQAVPTNLQDPQRFTVLGTKDLLDYEYTFTSRDGSERASNAKSAEVLVQLLAQIVNIPGLLQDLGKEKLYGFLNEVVRLSGAGVDLRFEVKDGESEQVKTGDPVTDSKADVDTAINQITQAIEQDRAAIQKIAGVINTIAPGALAQPPAAPPTGAQPQAPVSQPTQ